MIGVGVDAVEVDRFRQVLARRPGLAERLFTGGELDYARRKEAVLKALGVGLGAARFRDIEVVRADSGRPALRLSGRALALASARQVRCWHISLTHTAVQAVAVVMAE
jgi:holo-[acyl-carrier protein] synthase